MAVDVILIQDAGSSIYDTAIVPGKTTTELYLRAKLLTGLRLHGSNIKLNPCMIQFAFRYTNTTQFSVPMKAHEAFLIQNLTSTQLVVQVEW